MSIRIPQIEILDLHHREIWVPFDARLTYSECGIPLEQLHKYVNLVMHFKNKKLTPRIKLLVS